MAPRPASTPSRSGRTSSTQQQAKRSGRRFPISCHAHPVWAVRGLQDRAPHQGEVQGICLCDPLECHCPRVPKKVVQIASHVS